MKLYRFLPGVDPSAIPWLPEIVSLMMVRDAVAAALRWYKTIRDREHLEVEDHRDLLIAFVSVAGWTYEAIRTIQRLHGRPKAVITKDLVKGSRHEPLWDKWVDREKGDGFRANLKQVRDTYFGHWDPQQHVSREYISRIRPKDEIPPLVVWPGPKHTAATQRYEFAQAAYANDLFGYGFEKEPGRIIAKQRGEKVVEAAVDIMLLFDTVIAAKLAERADLVAIIDVDDPSPKGDVGPPRNAAGS